MSIEIEVHLPNGPPVTLDDYVTTLSLVAVAGTYSQFLALPDELYYDNPKTGTTAVINPAGGELAVRSESGLN